MREELEEYNLALGERRANSVRDFLVSLGVDAEELQLLAMVKKDQLLKVVYFRNHNKIEEL